MRKFEPGKVYISINAHSHNLDEKFEVIKRTKKTITVKSELGYSLTKRVIIQEDYEKIMVGYAQAIYA